MSSRNPESAAGRAGALANRTTRAETRSAGAGLGYIRPSQ